MGYTSRLTGALSIEPALSWSAIRNSRYYVTRGPDSPLVRFEITEENVETEEGTLVRRQAVAVVPTWGDQVKAYDLLDDVLGIVREVREAGSDCTGYIVRWGEDHGDVERITLPSLQVEKAELRWPNSELVAP